MIMTLEEHEIEMINKLKEYGESVEQMSEKLHEMHEYLEEYGRHGERRITMATDKKKTKAELEEEIRKLHVRIVRNEKEYDEKIKELEEKYLRLSTDFNNVTEDLYNRVYELERRVSDLQWKMTPNEKWKTDIIA